MRRNLLWLLVLIVPILSACAPHVQYRTEIASCKNDADVKACAQYSIEENAKYALGVVEFDDQGWFWDRRQMWTLIDRLSEEANRQDLLMVVFAHGWKHNASACDGNMSCFRETLKQVYDLETAAANAQKRKARKVFGIYLGWRGLSLEGNVLTNLTFWERKNTAHQVGSSAVTELLVRLNSIRYIKRNVTAEAKPSPTQLIIIGHSFGGAVIYSAVSQLLIDRFIDYRGEGAPPEPFGDLVILINPAFEAKRYEPLHQMALERSYLPGQMPIMAIITSQGDDATKKAFPIGRWFSTLFDKHRDADQKAANRTAVGHFARYRTHTLKSLDQKATPKKPADTNATCSCPYLQAASTLSVDNLQLLAAFRKQWNTGSFKSGWSQNFPGSVLAHDPYEKKSHPLNPFFVISVDNEIINGHNDIYRPVFVDFMRYFIQLSVPGRS
ncbi:MAG: esterase [Gammaproteobacteria bacterium]|nr:esterase [Gammaproteobacteria bacterium]